MNGLSKCGARRSPKANAATAALASMMAPSVAYSANAYARFAGVAPGGRRGMSSRHAARRHSFPARSASAEIAAERCE